MKLALALIVLIEVIAFAYLDYKDERAKTSEDAELVAFEYILLIIAVVITVLVGLLWLAFR